LDYWIILSNLIQELQATEIEPGFRSDHSAVTISFTKKTLEQRGPSFWHFNEELLKDVKYIEYIKQKIIEFKQKYEELENKGLLWGIIKMEIRSSTICYSKTKAKKNRNNIKELIMEIAKLEKEIAVHPDETTTSVNWK
jgi:hypothetical protein